MRARIVEVRAALVAAQPGRDHAVEGRHQRGGAVDHGRVDDLALARTLRLENAADQPQSEIERATGEIAEQVQGRRRRLAVPPEGVQRTDERNVVDVVSGGVRQRPLLTPAGDPAIDEARIACETVIRAEAEPLGHPGTEPLDQRVGAFDQAQCQRLPFGTLQVERQGPAAAQQQIVAQRARDAEVARLRPVDAQHGRAEIGEQHCAHRPGSDTREFHDLDAG